MIEQSQFTNVRVPVDNQRFVKCTFTNCVLVYYASGPARFEGCIFNDCTFGFDGAAANTVKFMTELYKVMPQTIEVTFDKIRLGI
ncbi:MAG TPA: hypothetical protein VGX91_13900 [Candidatus Cybelea sp.]|jgi:hypothetical protein|nr:hypothetical protein [Candidatus Cybelea sp.]